jgi:hypothetical protein
VGFREQITRDASGVPFGHSSRYCVPLQKDSHTSGAETTRLAVRSSASLRSVC